MGWYNTDWEFRRKITVSPDNIDANLTDHPLLLTETNFPDVFFFHVKSNGADIVATKADGTTKLKRELVGIDVANGTMELWVKTDLSATVDTEIYIYYGNAAATETDDDETWDNDFEVIYHLNENPSVVNGPPIHDSTSHGRNGTTHGTMLTEDLVAGIIGKCLDFDGGDDRISIGGYKGIGAAGIRTCELWTKSNTGSGSQTWMSWGVDLDGKKWIYYLHSDAYQRIGVKAGNRYGDTDVHDNAWHYLGLVLPSGVTDVQDTKLYVDGGLDGLGGRVSETINTDITISDVAIAYDIVAAAGYVTGLIDEVRISSVNRSAAYFKANYFNVTDEANFFSIGDREKIIGLNWNLAYFDDPDWVDITHEIKEITSLKYGIDNRIQGATPVLNILVDSSATYGTEKYKLELGDEYFLFGAPADGIVSLPSYRVSISLVDYLFYSMHNKVPFASAEFGESVAAGLGGGEFTITTTKNFHAFYKTKTHDMEIVGFNTPDDINYYDGQGNNINVTEVLRYINEGVIYGKDKVGYKGFAYPTINEILTGIASEEELTLQVDYGYSAEADSSGSTSTMPSTPFKIWDAKVVNNHILVLCSNEGYLRLRSYDLDGVYKDETYWTSRDFKESSVGIDNIGFLMHPDYYNGKVYVPMWRCASYATSGLNEYLLRISRISIDAETGAVSVDWNDDYSEADLFKTKLDASERPVGMTDTEFRTRLRRWQHYNRTRGSLGAKHMYLYADGTVTNFVIFKTTGGDVLYIIDPIKHQASEINWKYAYPNATARDYYAICPDHENGNIILITKANSTWYKEIFRVDMESLIEAESSAANTGALLAEDDPDNNAGNPSGVWRQSIYYDNSDQFYFPAHLPNGLLYKVEVQNRYTKTNADYVGFGASWAEDDFAGASWDMNLDRALVWKADADLDPTTLSWKIKDNYVYRRMYLYQPYIYGNRKLQFIDAFVGFGFFYQQINNVARLFRIRGTGESLGTLSNELFYEELDGFTRFADVYTIKCLNRILSYGSGTKTKEIKTIMGKYGFLSPLQADKYTADWITKVNSTNTGKRIHMDLDVFYGITSTYIPALGKTFIYDEKTYILIEAKIDLINWIIEVTGIEEA